MPQSTPHAQTRLTVQVAGRHVDLGEALRQRITDELNANVGKYFERGGQADVTVGKDRYAFFTDASESRQSDQGDDDTDDADSDADPFLLLFSSHPPPPHRPPHPTPAILLLPPHGHPRAGKGGCGNSRGGWRGWAGWSQW